DTTKRALGMVLCVKAVTEMPLKQARQSLTPAEMQRELGRYVIGQDAAKHALTNAYWRNTQRRKAKKKGISPKRYLPQANVLIAAPSGSGKTFLLDMFCDLFDVPHVSFPATALSAEGYVGCKPGDIVEALLANAKGS